MYKKRRQIKQTLIIGEYTIYNYCLHCLHNVLTNIGGLQPNTQGSFCCRRVLGCHPHPSCTGEALGETWSRSKQGCGWGLCLNRRYGAGPACDSLDHRAGACYLPRSLRTMNFVIPLAFTSLSVPPSAFWTCIALSQSGFPSFWSKNRCTSFIN